MLNQITPLEGYDYQIGILVWEMEHVRNYTTELTKDLSINDLDFNFDNLSNSIGTLLLHISALEFKFQLNHFFKRNINKVEYEKFNNALPVNMNKRLIHNNEFKFYSNTLKEVRTSTINQLKVLKDEWLFEKPKNSKKNLGNHYYLLKHIISDEIRHQGQINLILKRLEKSNQLDIGK